MRYTKMKKGSIDHMTIKIDLVKAYDSVKQSVLKYIMQCLGFIITRRFSILLNGLPFRYFASERGVQEGEPLLSALFTIFLDNLSHLQAKAASEERISRVKISRTIPKITQLMYAYVVIYGRVIGTEVTILRDLLQQYCDWTGQELNLNKLSVHFNTNVSRQKKHQICRILGMKECDHKGEYQGILFTNSKQDQMNSRATLRKLRTILVAESNILFQWQGTSP